MSFKEFDYMVNPECEEGTVDMSYLHYGRTNLTGQPVCGQDVVNMNHAYCQCVNLSGQPACGDRVVEMDGAYYGCCKLTGHAICGPNVKHMSCTYTNCVSLSEDAYFFSPDVEYAGGCFSGKDVNKRLNIYVPKDSTTLASCISEDYAFSLVSQDITWTYDENNNCYYNALYNIYIYPVDDVKSIYIEHNSK